MMCDPENLPRLVHTHNLDLNQVLQDGMLKVERSCGSFCLHMLSRGSRSELSKKWRRVCRQFFSTTEFIIFGVSCICLFSSRRIA